MPRGQTTIIRAPQGADKPEPILQWIVRRNASEEDEIQAKEKHYGKIVTADGNRRYRVWYVHRDEIHRLIATGVFMEEIDGLIALKNQATKPITVTHCGSTSKCKRRFQEVQLADTIAGKIVLTIGCNTKSDADLQAMGTQIDKIGLDILHLWKIDASDEVLILDITDDGQHYIGESARRELEYAQRVGKRIRFYSEEHK